MRNSSGLQSSTETIYQLPIQEVYAQLGTSPGGLSQAEADSRLGQWGSNTLQEIKGKPLILKLAANFTHVMAILLWAGGIVALVAQMPQLALAIWMVNIINGVFSFWQEYHAEKATEALRKLLPSYVHVIRDNNEQRILAEQLVPGDMILLAEGDRISADSRLVEAADLQVNQSTLTGESNPVHKISNPVPPNEIARAEIRNLVFAGTSVATGTGKAVVFATGMNTEFGKIASLTQSQEEEPSPLQKEMQVVTKVITLLVIGVGLVFFILSISLARMPLGDSFIFALGMLVALVPEGLLPTVTLSLAMGVQRMVKRHALIKRLSAVETLGCTTVICTDKTGTLTQNEMTVSNIWVGRQALKVTGVGYTPEGQILAGAYPQNINQDSELGQLLLAASLCNNARLLPPDGESSRWSILGDPTEGALLVAAQKGGITPDTALRSYPRLRELPFESCRKRMSTVHQNPADGGRVAFVKGAPREVLELCTTIRINGEVYPLDNNGRTDIMAANDRYARGGLRVLAVAMRPLSDPLPLSLSAYTPDVIEQNLTFLGLIAMMDPPRPEVTAAVQKCHHAGIRIIMITGDYGLTAESIARRIGIIQGDQPRIVTGSDLDQMDTNTLQETLSGEVIFARVAPEHKLRVVNALQDLGQVVAVTGDGVNDAPALKKADIGVAMGVTGTDVAKEAADMILTDDNFASIVNAIEEGRAVYSNIRKFAAYVFTSNVAEAFPFALFAFSAARIPLALNVMHVLSIDLGTDMVPAVALGAEPLEPGLMDRPPRKLSEHVFTKPMLARVFLWVGLIQGVSAMVSFYFMYWINGYQGQWLDLPDSGQLYRAATGMALAAVVTSQIGNVFAQRTERASVFQIGWFSNRLIWVGIAIELLLIGCIVYLPPIQNFIGTSHFPLENWLFLFIWTPILLLADEARKAVLRWYERRRD